MKVKCIKNDGVCGYFTDGLVYEAIQRVGYEDKPLRALEVTDDKGNTRVVIPGERCPHIINSRGEPVGVFVEIDK